MGYRGATFFINIWKVLSVKCCGMEAHEKKQRAHEGGKRLAGYCIPKREKTILEKDQCIRPENKPGDTKKTTSKDTEVENVKLHQKTPYQGTQRLTISSDGSIYR